MPVLGLIFLPYAYSRYKIVEEEILKNRPSRRGRVIPVAASAFAAKSALFLPKEAQYDYLLNLPEDIKAAGLKNKDGHEMTSLGEVGGNITFVAITNTSKTKFLNIKALYPTENICNFFNDFCKPIFKNIFNLSVAINKLTQARDRLLPKLMSGELEV